MSKKKKPKKKYLSRLLNTEGNFILYTHEELFGEKGIKADVAFTGDKAKGWTPEVNRNPKMPDGIRQSDASHIFMNFAYDQIDTDLPFMRTMAMGILFRNENNLTEDEVLLIDVFTKEPDPRILEELQFYPTKRPGIYRSKLSIFNNQTRL